MQALLGAGAVRALPDVAALAICGVHLVDPTGPGGIGPPMDIHLRDGLITAVAPTGSIDASGEAAVIRAEGRLATPGLVNAHTHSPLVLAKGTIDRASHSAFMWTNQADTCGLDPEAYYIAALLSAIEMIKNGTTAVIDHVPEQNPSDEAIDAIVQAYHDIGLRALVAIRVFDGAYDDIRPKTLSPQDAKALTTALSAGQGPAPQDAQLLLAQCEAAILRHADKAPTVRLCPAPSNPVRCTRSLLRGVTDLADRLDTAIHVHLLETPIQETLSRTSYGLSTVDLLEETGLLSQRLSAAHTIAIDEAGVRRLARGGATIVHNPQSNLKLGNGIAPIAAMRDAGGSVALGNDGSSTNDTQDLHGTMALAAMVSRLSASDRSRWLSVDDVRTMASVGGARALMMAETLGQLQPGLAADITLYDLDAMPFTPLNDAATQLVFAGAGAAVDTVIVGGRVLMRSGTFAGLDVPKIMSAARAVRMPRRDANPLFRRMAAQCI